MTLDRAVRMLPLSAAAIILLTFGPLGWSRDFGAFLIVVLVGVPILLVACLAILIWAIFEKRWMRRRSLLATLGVMILLPPAVTYGAKAAHDPIGFYVWYFTHPKIVEEFAHKDGIILDWNRWGMAGNESDSYLVSNPDDTISDLSAATAWAQRFEPGCEVGHSQRMKPGLYIIETYNCPLR